MKKKNIVRIHLCSIVCFLILTLYSLSAYGGEKNRYCGEEAFKKEIQAVVSKGTFARRRTGRTYYVAVNGKNSGKGTKKHPYRTIAYAVSKLKKGDTLYIRGGTYREQIRIPAKISGKKNAYIMIAGVPGEKVWLSGKGKTSPTLMEVCGSSYLVIQNIGMKAAHGQDACGINVRPGSHHIVILDNTIQDIRVKNPQRPDHCCNAVLLYGDSAKKEIHDVLLYGNRIHDCTTGWAECISVTGNVRNVNIIGNTIRRTGNIGIDLSGNYGYCSDPAKDFPRECYVAKNQVSECHSPVATAYGIYADGARNVTIYRNTVKKCDGGIEAGAEQKPKKDVYATKNITIEQNTILDNAENAITVGGYQTDLGWVKTVKIRHNICRENGRENAILTLAKCDGVEITDNVFYNSKGSSAIVYAEFSDKYTKNIVFRRNSYYNGHAKNKTNFVYQGRTYTKFEQWKKTVGKAAGQYRKVN